MKRFVNCCALVTVINILLFLTEQVSPSLMPFYYVQDVYQKNQLGTRLDKRQK